MHANVTAKSILADGRWQAQHHGIGRFAIEVLSRLQHADILTDGPWPLSLKNLFWQTSLLRNDHQHQVFFSPGFNPCLTSALPYVLTVYDLTHLAFPGKGKWVKKAFYELLIKPSLKRAHKILTVSEYSKNSIVSWAKLSPEKVIVVGCGVSAQLTPNGERYQPGFPYLLHVGNNKPHKNRERLINAFAKANISPEMRLLFTGPTTTACEQLIARHGLENRIVFCPTLSESTLASYYRGASGLVLPSLLEGFGLPVIEAMACGTPVLTANITSLPEVAGGAALLVDPYHVKAITHGIETLVNNRAIRETLIHKGFSRAREFSWDVTAEKVQRVLDEVG